jgi:hypothetical protein
MLCGLLSFTHLLKWSHKKKLGRKGVRDLDGHNLGEINIFKRILTVMRGVARGPVVFKPQIPLINL